MKRVRKAKDRLAKACVWFERESTIELENQYRWGTCVRDKYICGAERQSWRLEHVSVYGRVGGSISVEYANHYKISNEARPTSYHTGWPALPSQDPTRPPAGRGSQVLGALGGAWLASYRKGWSAVWTGCWASTVRLRSSDGREKGVGVM